MKRYAGIALVILSLFLLKPLETSAQQVSSFQQLQLLVKSGDKIYVTDSSGTTIRGEIENLLPSSLHLIVNGVRRDFSQSDVSEIKQWRHDPMSNGAAIGAGIGLVSGIITGLAVCHRECSTGVAAASFGAVYTGIGAAIGVGLDALIPTRQTVFRNAGGNSALRLRFQPILNRSTKGLSMSLSF